MRLSQFTPIRAVAALAVLYCCVGRTADLQAGLPNTETADQDVGFAIGGQPPALFPAQSSESPGPLKPAASIVPIGFTAPDDQQNYGAPPGQSAGVACDAIASCCEARRHGLIVFVDYDAFRGISDGGWENNGINAGVNFGTRLGEFSDRTGIGFQIGGSAAAYDWSGTDYRLFRQDEAEVQGFVTYGLFRHATEDCPWSAAVVQDWMINANFGVFASNPTLSQLRLQAGYAISDATEFGIWGAWRLMDDSRDVPGVGDVRWRSIDQLSGYWHYQWNSYGPESWVWIGVPERDRLGASGSLGDWLVGALTTAPLADRLGMYALVTYMHPSARPGGVGATEDSWNFTIGLAFFPGGNARNRSVYGERWMPQLPVANNGYFLVDTH